MPSRHLVHFIVRVLTLVSSQTSSVQVPSTSTVPPKRESRLVFEEPRQPRYTTVEPSILNQAMLGVNPFNFDQLDSWKTGLKDQIFTPVSAETRSHDTFQLNEIIGKAVIDRHCTPLYSPSMRTVYNYNSFRDFLSESISFEDKDTKIGCQLCTDFSTEFETGSNDHKKLVEFFTLGGEVVLGEVKCQTHVVSVNLNARPNFTQNFVTAARKVISAAKNPLQERSRESFLDFVDNFGTHFQDKTLFGSRLLMMKIFTRKSANISEHVERLRCVSSSFTQNVHMISNFNDFALNFSKIAARCENLEESELQDNSLEIPRDNIRVVGSALLFDDNEDNVRPVPIYRRLKKLSHLFEYDWFDYFDSPEDRVLLLEFFEKMVSEYKNLHQDGSFEVTSKVGCGYNSNCSLKELCIENNSTSEGFICVPYCNIQSTCADNEACVNDDNLLGYRCLKGCGLTSNCSDNTVCVDDDSLDGYSCRKGCNFTANCPPQTICMDDDSDLGFTCVDPCTPESCAPGEACHAEEHSRRGFICVPTKPGKAVIIGGLGHGSWLRSVEHVNIWSLPELPLSVAETACATVGDTIYICGELPDQIFLKKCFRIPINAPGHEWEFFAPDVIQIYGHSAVSVDNSLVWFIRRTALLEFFPQSEIVAIVDLPFVSNYGHCSVSNGTHVYVIGAGEKENEIWMSTKNSGWDLVGHLRQGRFDHACLWYGSNIMITGGHSARDDVEIFNTETSDVWQGQNLLTGREGHGMMLLNGEPTVVGGWNGRELSTFESFSIASNQWTQLERTLANPIKKFCLVEVE